MSSISKRVSQSITTIQELEGKLASEWKELQEMLANEKGKKLVINFPENKTITADQWHYYFDSYSVEFIA